MKYSFGILILILSFASCEKDITVDIPPGDSKYVVEGYVEEGLPPYLFLSRSESYFAPIDQNQFGNLPVRNALVVISDGFVSDTLIEVDTTINGISYGGFYFSTKLLGVPGRTYNLYVSGLDGVILTSTTTLRPPVALDSLWFEVFENLDSLGYVWARLNEPDTSGNCYRWLAKRIGKDESFIAPLGSVFEDKFINGQNFNFNAARGSVQNSTADDDNNEEAGYFKQGDSIVVRFASVDRPVFEFWRDAENQLGSNGSPFAVPSNIKGNINGGLGLFGGYSYFVDTLVAIP